VCVCVCVCLFVCLSVHLSLCVYIRLCVCLLCECAVAAIVTGASQLSHHKTVKTIAHVFASRVTHVVFAAILGSERKSRA